MRRTSFVATVVVFTTVLSIATAFATPPTGNIKFTEYGRVQAADNASVPIKGGTNLAMGVYAVAPGGKTGWRSLPGSTVLVVTKGKLMLHGVGGCGTKDYAAGQAAPPGLASGGDRVQPHRQVAAPMDRDGGVVGGLHPGVVGELDVSGRWRGEGGGHGESGCEDDDGGDE